MNATVYHPENVNVRKVVSKMWIVEEAGNVDFLPEKIIPFGSFELLFHLGNSFAQSFDQNNWILQPKVMMTGHYERSVLVKALGNYKSLGISFYPWCGNLFCRFPLSEITSLFASGEFIDRDFLFKYWYKFQEPQETKCIFRLAEEMIEIQLKSYRENTLTKNVVGGILENPNVELSQLYQGIAYSPRRIEQIFLENVGISAKFLKKKIRFQRALKLAKNNPQLSLTEVAYQMGYYDQANFIKVFREFTGEAPKAFLKNREDIGVGLI